MADVPPNLPPKDNAPTQLSLILQFLYTDTAALSVANARLAAGFKPKRPTAKECGCRMIKCKKTLAQALGYPSHTGLIPEKGTFNLARAAEVDLRDLYQIPETSPCWSAFTKQLPDDFKVNFRLIVRPGGKPLATSEGNRVTKSGPFGWTRPSLADRLVERVNALAIEERHGVDFSTGDVTLAFDRLVVEKIERVADDAPSHDDWRCARKVGDRPRSNDTQFVNLQLRPVLRNDPLSPQKLELDLGLGETDGGLFIRECLIVFALSGDTEAEPLGDRKAWPGTLVLHPPQAATRPRIEIKPYGPTLAPGFTVRVMRGPLPGLTAKDVLSLEKLRIGDVIEARLIVRLSGLASPAVTSAV